MPRDHPKRRRDESAEAYERRLQRLEERAKANLVLYVVVGIPLALVGLLLLDLVLQAMLQPVVGSAAAAAHLISLGAGAMALGAGAVVVVRRIPRPGWSWGPRGDREG